MWNTADHSNFGAPKREQAGGFLSTTVTSPASQEKKKPERLTNVVACTIAQILKMQPSDEHLKVGSISARMITFVGIAHSMEVQSTKVTYLVNDLTGPSVEVQMWVGDNHELGNKLQSIRENTYVKVTGAVRFMKDKRHVIAFKVAPVTSVNEITMHIIETMHTSMAIAAMDKQENFSATGMSSSVLTGATGSAVSMMESVATRGLSKPQQIVLQAISSCTDVQGISIYDLYNNIKTLSRQAVKEAVDFLGDNCHIYSTIDEHHFKSTESM